MSVTGLKRIATLLVVWFAASCSAKDSATGPVSSNKYVLSLSNPNPFAGTSTTVTAYLTDANGNGISTGGKIVTWSKTGVGGSFSSATSVTNPIGIATITFTTGPTIGTYTLTATDNSSVVGTSPVLTTVPGPVVANLTTLSASATAVAANGSSTSIITTRLVDAYGNAQTTSGAFVQLFTTRGTISPVVDNRDGTYAATLTSSTAAGTATVTAQVDGGLIQSSVAVTFVAGVASKLGFVIQPTSALPDATIAPGIAVAFQDQFGNTVPVASDDVTISIVGGTGSAGATLTGTKTVKALNGVATFSDLTISSAGTGYRLAASTSSLAGATSATFNLIAFTSVATGAGHSCALSTLGAAYCWGGINYDVRAIEIPGGIKFSRIAARVDDSCAATSVGSEYCWDRGFRTPPAIAAIGTVASYSARPSATVGGISLTNIVQGGEHQCGLNSNGAVYCWGSNQWGAFGTGVSSSKTAPPTTVPVPAIGGLAFVSIAAGRHHTCGVATDGFAYCWGTAMWGELGDGGTTLARSFPSRVTGATKFTTVASSDIHTCGVTTIGEIYCWGYNASGQIGSGVPPSNAVAVPTRVTIP